MIVLHNVFDMVVIVDMVTCKKSIIGVRNM